MSVILDVGVSYIYNGCGQDHDVPSQHHVCSPEPMLLYLVPERGLFGCTYWVQNNYCGENI